MTVPRLYLGIDIGTQGVRALAVTEDGVVVGAASQPLQVPKSETHQEQEPESWWNAVVDVVQQLGSLREAICSLALSCTSGSVCMVDRNGDPIGPGLLYADPRAIAFDGKGSSWAVSKIAWLLAHESDLADRCAHFTSPGGFVATRLLGEIASIDVTQALKFGFDPGRSAWNDVPVDQSKLPAVVATGVELGVLCASAAQATGLRLDTRVVSGATDGVAGQFACRPTSERWAVSIGSTIVWKAMADRRIDSETLGVYSHRGPGQWWLPGAAATAGARILSDWATDTELTRFGNDATFAPTVRPAYPSVVRGERFPFDNPNFEPWTIKGATGIDRYKSELLGAAFVERWGCDVLVHEGCAAPRSIASTGGAVASTSWTQLRSDVMQTSIEIPAEPSSAFGAAVLAASPLHGGVLEASEAMVRFARVVEPDPAVEGQWDDAFAQFQHRCLQTQESDYDHS